MSHDMTVADAIASSVTGLQYDTQTATESLLDELGIPADWSVDTLRTCLDLGVWMAEANAAMLALTEYEPSTLALLRQRFAEREAEARERADSDTAE